MNSSNGRGCTDIYTARPRKTLTDKIDQGIDVLLEIDVQGALQVKKKFDDAVSVFILPPSMTVLRQRLLARASDSSDEIQRRLQKVKEEVWSYREYAYIVKNDDLTRSLARSGKHFSR